MLQEPKTILQFAEHAVLAAIREAPDIFISVPHFKTGKDPYGQKVGYIGHDGKKYDHIQYYMLGERRIRSFWSPSLTRDTFERCVVIDYAKMREDAAKLKKVIDAGRSMHVTAPGGTDVTISIEGRLGYADDGEVYVSPVVGSTKGTIVYDGTLDLIPHAVQPKEPVRLDFKNGYIDKVTGGADAEALLNVIRSGEKRARENGLVAEERNARNIGELGIGLNYKAKMVNNMLEDEKVGKTCHFAIGFNYDNDGPALIHQDCLVKSPSIWVDDIQILKDGEIII